MSVQNNYKLLDEVRNFMRLHHYSIHTENKNPRSHFRDAGFQCK